MRELAQRKPYTAYLVYALCCVCIFLISAFIGKAAQASPLNPAQSPQNIPLTLDKVFINGKLLEPNIPIDIEGDSTPSVRFDWHITNPEAQFKNGDYALIKIDPVFKPYNALFNREFPLKDGTDPNKAVGSYSFYNHEGSIILKLTFNDSLAHESQIKGTVSYHAHLYGINDYQPNSDPNKPPVKHISSSFDPVKRENGHYVNIGNQTYLVNILQPKPDTSDKDGYTLRDSKGHYNVQVKPGSSDPKLNPDGVSYAVGSASWSLILNAEHKYRGVKIQDELYIGSRLKLDQEGKLQLTLAELNTGEKKEGDITYTPSLHSSSKFYFTPVPKDVQEQAIKDLHVFDPMTFEAIVIFPDATKTYLLSYDTVPNPESGEVSTQGNDAWLTYLGNGEGSLHIIRDNATAPGSTGSAQGVRGSVLFMKHDTQGKGLRDAHFSLYLIPDNTPEASSEDFAPGKTVSAELFSKFIQPKNFAARATSGSRGLGLIKGLILKDARYLLVEETAPAGYEKSNTALVVKAELFSDELINDIDAFSKGNATEEQKTHVQAQLDKYQTTIVNQTDKTPPPLGSFYLKKVNNKGEALPNVPFSLIKPDFGGSTTFFTTPTGEARFTGLKPGAYFLKENGAPDGYEKDTNTYTILVDNKGVCTIIDARGLVIDPETGIPLGGASKQFVINSSDKALLIMNVPPAPENPEPPVPNEPEKPTEPENPEPPVPGEPEKPVTPEKPTDPVPPTPEKPEEPTEPGVPPTPEKPEQPTEPGMPPTPEKPEVPETPTKPEDPKDPGEPPRNPNEPYKPFVPTQPQEPPRNEVPSKPEIPDMPKKESKLLIPKTGDGRIPAHSYALIGLFAGSLILTGAIQALSARKSRI